MAKEPLTVKDYASLGYDKLHKEILKMVQQAEHATVWFNTDKQLRLLPALTALKGLVAQPGRRFVVTGQPGWEDECRSLGLTAEQVRQQGSSPRSRRHAARCTEAEVRSGHRRRI